MLVSQDELTTAAVSGDVEALTQLLHHHDPDLRGWLRGRIGVRYRSILDAEDVLQVTYVEAYLRIGQFEPRGSGSFKAWLRRIAANNIADAIKTLNRQKRPSPARRVGDAVTDESYVTLLASLPGHGTSPTSGAARSEASDLIEKALRKLPPDYEKVIRLCDLEGRPADDVADQMERSRGAIHMLKARAHDRLAELLGGSTNFFSKGT